MSPSEWDEVLRAAYDAVKERRYEAVLALADQWIAGHGAGDSRALWFRAKALTELGQLDAATTAWEELIALPVETEPELVTAADAHDQDRRGRYRPAWNDHAA
jgi:hypothetical protein